jgi:hypothetical protein
LKKRREPAAREAAGEATTVQRREVDERYVAEKVREGAAAEAQEETDAEQERESPSVKSVPVRVTTEEAASEPRVGRRERMVGSAS